VNELVTQKTLTEHAGNSGKLVFAPNGKRLIAFNTSKKSPTQLVVVWNVLTGKEVIRFMAPRPAQNGGREAVAVSEGTLAIGLEDGGTSLWDLATGKERRLATNHISNEKGQGYGTFAVAFTPDGTILVTGGRDGVVKLWEVATGRHLRSLERHYSWVESLAVSPDGQMIASSGQDGIIRLWNTRTGADACPQPGHHAAVLWTALSPDGRIAITAGLDSSVRWWDASSGRELRANCSHGPLHGLAISPDGEWVVASVNERRLQTWKVATGRETTNAELREGFKAERLLFTPDGRHLATAFGPEVTIWDWPALRISRKIEIPRPAKQPGENSCQGLAISSDSRWLVTVAYRASFREVNGLRFGIAEDGVADVWDFATGKRVHRLAESQGTYQSATFTADGRLVLIGGGGGSIPVEAPRRLPETFKGEISLLDPLAARWLRSFTSPPPTPGVAYRYTGSSVLSRDGRTLYVSYSTGEIVGFEVATGQPRRTFSGHRGFIWALSFAPDGRRLLSGSNDGSALLWDVTFSGAARLQKDPIISATVEKHWSLVSDREAKPAFDAMVRLAALPDSTIELIRRQVKPISNAPTDADIDRIFASLDSPRFATREKASAELAAFGELAVPAVQRRFGPALSPEVRERTRVYLEKFDPRKVSLTRLRQIRAIELLEGIGNQAAKTLLSELAKGPPEAPLTLDATAALGRLGQR